MSIAEKLQTISENEQKVYDKGYKTGENDFFNMVTNNGTMFYGMFYGCSNLTTVPQLDTSKGINFTSMFESCTNLTTIPQLDTSNGRVFQNMFQNCKRLTTIPQFDTSKGTSFSSMFRFCSGLTTIPQLDTSNVTNFQYTFYGCSNLTIIPQLDTSKGIYFTNTFYNCSKLEDITIVGTINAQFDIKYSTLLTHQSLISILNALSDRTSTTALKLYIGTTNMEKLTSEELDIAYNKNWEVY